jgi:hypothetical protein
VRLDVLAADVGNEGLEPMRLPVEDQAGLQPLLPIAKPSRAKEDSDLQRHVETRQASALVELDSRDVMDTELRLFDDPIDLFDTCFGCVFDLERTTRIEAAVQDGKDQRVEDRVVRAVEGAVDEDLTRVRRSRHAAAIT